MIPTACPDLLQGLVFRILEPSQNSLIYIWWRNAQWLHDAHREFAGYGVEVLSSGNYSFVLFFSVDFPLWSLPKRTIPCLPAFFPFAECEPFCLSMQLSVSERPLHSHVRKTIIVFEDCWFYHLSKKKKKIFWPVQT